MQDRGSGEGKDLLRDTQLDLSNRLETARYLKGPRSYSRNTTCPTYSMAASKPKMRVTAHSIF